MSEWMIGFAFGWGSAIAGVVIEAFVNRCRHD